MAGIALSRFGIVPQAFYEITPKEFDFAIRDFDERKITELKSVVEINQQTIWESTRWLAWWLHNVASVKGTPKKIDRPEKLAKFSWEKKKEEEQSLEQMRAILYALAGKIPPDADRNISSKN